MGEGADPQDGGEALGVLPEVAQRAAHVDEEGVGRYGLDDGADVLGEPGQLRQEGFALRAQAEPDAEDHPALPWLRCHSRPFPAVSGRVIPAGAGGVPVASGPGPAGRRSAQAFIS